VNPIRAEPRKGFFEVPYSQKWLGHAQLTTTALYANAVGEEEQEIAARMW
jgi:hypothetical protein